MAMMAVASKGKCHTEVGSAVPIIPVTVIVWIAINDRWALIVVIALVIAVVGMAIGFVMIVLPLVPISMMMVILGLRGGSEQQAG